MEGPQGKLWKGGAQFEIIKSKHLRLEKGLHHKSCVCVWGGAGGGVANQNLE